MGISGALSGKINGNGQFLYNFHNFREFLISDILNNNSGSLHDFMKILSKS